MPALKLEVELAPNAHLESLDKREVSRLMDQELLIKAADCEIVFVGLLKNNSWVQDECLNLKSLARLSNWRDSDSSARYAYRVNVTSASAIYHEFEGGVWKPFLLGEGGQLSSMPKLSSEGGDGVKSEEEKDD